MEYDTFTLHYSIVDIKYIYSRHSGPVYQTDVETAKTQYGV